MQVNLDTQYNQSPEIPGNRARREERRQKACALRTFKRAKFLSPAIASMGRAEEEAETGCLSIQIDTFPAMPVTVRDIFRTAFAHGTLSRDNIGTSRDIIMSLSYKMGSCRDSFAAHGDRNQRANNSRRVWEGQNA